MIRISLVSLRCLEASVLISRGCPCRELVHDILGAHFAIGGATVH